MICSDRNKTKRKRTLVLNAGNILLRSNGKLYDYRIFTIRIRVCVDQYILAIIVKLQFSVTGLIK